MQIVCTGGIDTPAIYRMGIPTIQQPGIKFIESSISPTNTTGTSAGFIWVQILTDKFQYILKPIRISNQSPRVLQPCLWTTFTHSVRQRQRQRLTVPEVPIWETKVGARMLAYNATIVLNMESGLPSGCTPPSTTPLEIGATRRHSFATIKSK
jgi:hypothetical protein